MEQDIRQLAELGGLTRAEVEAAIARVNEQLGIAYRNNLGALIAGPDVRARQFGQRAVGTVDPDGTVRVDDGAFAVSVVQPTVPRTDAERHVPSGEHHAHTDATRTLIDLARRHLGKLSERELAPHLEQARQEMAARHELPPVALGGDLDAAVALRRLLLDDIQAVVAYLSAVAAGVSALSGDDAGGLSAAVLVSEWLRAHFHTERTSPVAAPGGSSRRVRRGDAVDPLDSAAGPLSSTGSPAVSRSSSESQGPWSGTDDLQQQLADFRLGSGVDAPLSEEPEQDFDPGAPVPPGQAGTGVEPSEYRTDSAPPGSVRPSRQGTGRPLRENSAGVSQEAMPTRPARRPSAALDRRKSSAGISTASDPQSLSRRQSIAQNLGIDIRKVSSAMEGGVPDVISQRLRDLADRHNLVVSFRLTNVESLPWNAHGGAAVGKPEAIKAKSASEVDSFLGLNRALRGLVAYYRPNRPDPARLRAESPERQQQIWRAYATRMRDYVVLAADMRKLKGRFRVEPHGIITARVLVGNDGTPIRAYREGSSVPSHVAGASAANLTEKWVPVTSDYDLMHITDENGGEVPQEQKQEFLAEALAEGYIEHPELMGWEPPNERGQALKKRLTEDTKWVLTYAPAVSPFVERYPPDVQNQPSEAADDGRSGTGPQDQTDWQATADKLYAAYDPYLEALHRLTNGTGQPRDTAVAARDLLAHGRSLASLETDPFTPWAEAYTQLPARVAQLASRIPTRMDASERRWRIGALLAAYYQTDDSRRGAVVDAVFAALTLDTTPADVIVANVRTDQSRIAGINHYLSGTDTGLTPTERQRLRELVGRTVAERPVADPADTPSDTADTVDTTEAAGPAYTAQNPTAQNAGQRRNEPWRMSLGGELLPVAVVRQPMLFDLAELTESHGVATLSPHDSDYQETTLEAAQHVADHIRGQVDAMADQRVTMTNAELRVVLPGPGHGSASELPGVDPFLTYSHIAQLTANVLEHRVLVTQRSEPGSDRTIVLMTLCPPEPDRRASA
ncbi:hypothetical protein ABZT06_42490 [Streptomyces sp. NPDC005483]|uniref:hypothetical protein n=1 Tax=Streptomyces sp. NPDC005483 TaxID=3154882 RepID=UPI0033BAE320